MFKDNDKFSQKSLNRYLRKEAKKAQKNVEVMVGLTKNPDIIKGVQLLRFCTPAQAFTVSLYFGFHLSCVFAQASKPSKAKSEEPTCELQGSCKSPKLNIIIKPGLAREQCDFLDETFAEIKTKLPDSTASIDRVLAQKGLTFSCVEQSDLLPTVQAKYFSHNMTFLYKARNKNDFTSLFARLWHHEKNHADTHLRHSTSTCNNVEFAGRSLKSIDKILGRRALLPGYKSHFVTTPPFPPTDERVVAFKKMVYEDMDNGKTADLIRLHKKYFYNQKEMTNAELVNYNRYKNLLSNSLLSDELIFINTLPPGSRLPTVFMSEEGIIFYDLKIEKRGSDLELLGVIKDPVSTFIDSCRIAKIICDEKYDNLPLYAITELEAHLGTGISNAAVQEFFPRLWRYLQQEKACCFEGDLDECEKMFHFK